MPAPSPVRPSAARAPRWVIAAAAASASRTTSWVAEPPRSARNPTPHASCSSMTNGGAACDAERDPCGRGMFSLDFMANSAARHSPFV
jgi:hypothetical protein